MKRGSHRLSATVEPRGARSAARASLAKALTRREAIGITGGLLASLALAGCAGAGGSAKTEPKGIALKGSYLVKPDEAATNGGVDFSAIPDTRELLLFVYDLENTTGSNWDSIYPEVKLTYPSGNEFEPSESDLPDQMRTFLKRCGYSSADDWLDVDAGGKPQRVIAAFLVNTTDVEGKDAGTLSVEYGRGTASGTFEVAGETVKTITWPDEVFEVEDDPDAYQLVHSMPGRAGVAQNLLGAAVTAFNSGDTSRMTLALTTATAYFEENVSWGVSLMTEGSTFLGSESLPKLSYEDLGRLDATAASDAQTLYEQLGAMNTALASGDVTTANTLKGQISPLLSNYSLK